MTTRNRVVSVAALTVAAMLVSGCGGGDDDPGPQTTSSPAARPIESATPEPPELPEAAKVLDRPGAEAFVRHYFGLVNYANATGDTTPMDVITNPGCLNCPSVAERARSLNADGSRLEGGEIVVQAAVAAPVEDGTTAVSTVLQQQPGRVVDQSGTMVQDLPAPPKESLSVYVVIADDQWRIFDLAAVPS